jgi:hypothetical protein
MNRTGAISVSPSPGPFWTLVLHFVKRLFAPESEQGSGTMGLGLGTVLAILASPGAFASIFLMDKYSTLLQWLRHQHFDPYKASAADEYFFIVLSMTITGLIMVLRWNRLFPDRRDFENLAPLPIPIRNIFFANFTALAGLAVLFAIDVNAVSSFLFPLFVALSIDTFSAFFHVAICHVVTVLAASLFSFFGVFALVGTLMLIAPKRLFRPLSVAARMFLVVALLTEFLSNLFLQLFAGRLPGHSAGYVEGLPSFWFLGLYENVLGTAKPVMLSLGVRAQEALAAVIVVAVVSYTLCYRRYFLRLPESQEMLGGSRHGFRLPERIAKLLFRSSFDHACCSFVVKVLMRSEQHLMFFGGYLGIGLVMVAQTAFDSANDATPGSLPNSSLLAIPLMITFFVVSGLGFVFDIPAALDANWVFRLTVVPPVPDPRLLARKLMLCAVLPWQILVLTPLMALRFGWPVAIGHTAVVVALTLLTIDALLLRFRKIPFTCSVQPELKQLLARILLSVFAVLIIVPMLAASEHWMFLEPWRFFGLAVALAFGWGVLRRYRRDMLPADRALTFDDHPKPQFELLKLA